MKNPFLLFCLALVIGLTSCSKDQALDVSDEDIQLLQTFVDEANELVPVAGQIEGNVVEIFNSTAFINGCAGTVLIGDFNGGVPDEATLLLAEILEKMNFESAVEVHDWVVAAGRIMYDIKQENKQNFDSDRALITELACMVSPEIFTRNSSQECYKDNLVSLFIGTLEAGDNYSTTLAVGGKKDISEAGCSARGSSFYKVWQFINVSYNCD